MTKNLIDLSQALLSKFTDLVGNQVSGRFSEPEDLAAEIESLKSLASYDLWQSPSGARVFHFKHQYADCLALTFEISEKELELLEQQSGGTIKTIEVPGSIFLFLAEQLNLKPVDVTPEFVDQYIAGPASSDEGVQMEVIKKYLEKISVFQLSNESIFKKPISWKYVANYISTFDPQITSISRLTPRSLEIIRDIFLQEKDNLIEDNLFEAMKTPLVRHAFLEIYRTLEFIFVLPRANALHEQLRLNGAELNIKILDFARHCYQELGWKRVERDSIVKLFQEYAESNYDAFNTLILSCQPFTGINADSQKTSAKEQVDLVRKVAEKYYLLRNQTAHQFWPDEMLPCNDEDWQTIIDFTLGCISFFYEKYLSKTSMLL